MRKRSAAWTGLILALTLNCGAIADSTPSGGSPATQPISPDSPNIENLPPGLKIVVKAKGSSAKKGDTLLVHYVGKLQDGTEFDNSLKRGTPFKLTLGGGEVIQGWDLGLVGMEVGEKRQITIPPELGYGKEGAGTAIPPNATLVFDVELIGMIRQ